VTVLFCDVTGSTALGESVHPEALRAVLGRYFGRMKAMVGSHGGTVEKFIGDAVMAVFGVPVVHEDDALRAVRAAAEMREALPDLGVQARIGVNTGEIVTGSGDSLATGDPVNVAARLEQAAAPGEVLLGAGTLRLVRDAVDAEPVDPLVLKGKSGPVAAFGLLSVRVDERERPATLMVGRERELPRLPMRRAGRARSFLSAVRRSRERGCGEVAIGGGVPGACRRARRARPLSLLRRRHYVLARRGGGQATRRAPVGRRGR